MSPRKRQFITDQYYHIFNRGNEARTIFFEKDNYLFFLKRLSHYLMNSEIVLICYCLMPTHFHLLMRQGESTSISTLMSSLGTSFAKAINKRYDRVGHLFQGRFQHRFIDKTEYLLHLTRYIHMNPVKSNLVDSPEDWEFSSYRDFIGLRRGKLPRIDILHPLFVDDSVTNLNMNKEELFQERYRNFVQEYHEEQKLSAYIID